MTAFGQVLKDIRAARGLSQSDLALHLGTTQRHLSFVETGRSRPTSSFVTRLCRELNMPLAQRANLFAAAGLPQAYPAQSPTSDEMAAALDTIDQRVLANWPFPAIVMNPAWTILRANPAFWTLFAPFMPDAGNSPQNLAEIMMQPQFRALIGNWSAVAELFYYRLQLASAHHEEARAVFARLKAAGLFDDMPDSLTPAPMLLPVDIRFPDGTALRLTSLIGRLMAIQDPTLESYEVEFFVPLDSESEQIMKALQPARATQDP